jgi:hypothetical protein
MSDTLIEKVQEKIESETGIKVGHFGLQEVTFRADHSMNKSTKVHVFQWATHHGSPFCHCGTAVVIDRRGRGSDLSKVSVEVGIGISEDHKRELVKIIPPHMRAANCDEPPSPSI